MQLTLETKGPVIDGIYRKDSTFTPIEFGVSQPEYDPVRNTDELVKLLADFSMLKADELEAMLEGEHVVLKPSLILKRPGVGEVILGCADGMRDLDEELLAR